MTSALKTTVSSFPSQGVIRDLAGLPVDATGVKWVLNSAQKLISLDWDTLWFMSPSTLQSTCIYITSLIETRAPQSVENAFTVLRKLHESPSFVQSERDDTEIPEAIFSEMRRYLGDNDWQLHHLRHWYRWCSDMGCPSFSAEVSFAFDERRVGGNKKGQAVLSLSPEDGPLNDLEVTALLNALIAATRAELMSDDERAALWLCISLGSNPSQLALLREEDVEVTHVDGARFVQLRVPRVKKRYERPRTGFRTRKLVDEVADVVIRLMKRNRLQRDASPIQPIEGPFPLFVRNAPRPSASVEVMPDYANHLYSEEFTRLVSRAVESLKVVSPRTGNPLRVTTRRLRYTFATRLVREGASMRALADALDHTDLQNVRVYFDVKSDIVDSLDRAMALALGPRAQAFLGKLVGTEADAVRGDDLTSRVAVLDQDTGHFDAVGTCGQHSFCSLYAPIACYTCSQFQPWKDGPHDIILRDLIQQRERRASAGQDGRMVAMHDATILAIGDVIARIEKALAGGDQ